MPADLRGSLPSLAADRSGGDGWNRRPDDTYLTKQSMLSEYLMLGTSVHRGLNKYGPGPALKEPTFQ